MELFTYFPTWFQILLLIAVLAFGYGVYHYRFVEHSYRNAWEMRNQPSAQQRRVKLNTTEFGYTDVIGEIPVGEKDSDLTIKIQLDDLKQHATGADIQNVRLTGPDPEAEVSDFTYMLLYDQYAWARNSALSFENPGGKTNSFIEEALNEYFVRDAVAQSPIVFCIGLASSEPTSSTLITNTVLSDRRAVNLCVALARLGFIEIEHPHGAAIALGIGERQTTDGAKVSRSERYRRERAAIILAIKEPRNRPTTEQLIEVVYKIMEHRDIGLGRYVRDDSKRYNSIVVGDTEYVSDGPLETSPMPDQEDFLRTIGAPEDN